PAELHAIVRVALARDPAERWQSIGDVAKMLKAVAARLGTSVTDSATTKRSILWTLVPSLAALVLGVKLVGLALRPPQAPPRRRCFRPDEFVGADAGVRGLARWARHCFRCSFRDPAPPVVDSIRGRHRGTA